MTNAPVLEPVKQAMFDPPGDPPPQTFEIGLVLGGTVSAGAYTAGALDLLMQALDGFSTQTDPPPHAVRVRLAAGSSGGAVTAAVFGVSLDKEFENVTADQASLNVEGGGPAGNKLWDLWVNRLQFVPMLDVDDLDAPIQDPASPPGSPPPGVQHVPALLNGKVIDASVDMVVAYAQQPGTIVRPWAASPFRLATTVCNLRGMPFCVAGTPANSGFVGSSYVEHDDFAWFAVPNVVGGGDGAIGHRLPNEFWLSAAPTVDVSVGYDTLGNYARASGAMPVGLPARSLHRPAEHYLYRPFSEVDSQGNLKVAWPSPHWAQLPEVLSGGAYVFTGVDGGTLNNDPVKIAHDALSGVGMSNPRAPEQAHRALFLIDPLADQPTNLDPVGLSIVGVIKGLFGTFVGGARYLTSDLELFQSETVFSRFQLVPTRKTGDGTIMLGEAALAGTDLAALGGWCAREFRVHDFLLGRLNMRDYLRHEFLLRGDNPLFAKWPLGMVNDYCCEASGDRLQTEVTSATDKTTYYLPVIPIPPEGFDVVTPAWPVGALDPQRLYEPLKQRSDGVLGKLRADNIPGFAGWLIGLIVLGGVAQDIAKDIVQGLTKTLTDRGLIAKEEA